ncbi:myotubularin-related protein 10-B isoform X2 [Periplaneta americana]|uniref:myotubularin-related protein 10-B isoform X2 n=1 Tax=Periplaneta americana TaxID=6978 RepID=UPI0037E99732
MNETKMSNSFKSYVGFDDHDSQSLNTSGEDSFSELNPRLLPGEVVIAEAQNVLLFAPVSEQKQGKSGNLSVTNYKLTFVTTEERQRENMKVLSFSFKFSPVGHGKTLTNALLHHAFPRRHQLLFAYDYREPYYNCQRDVCSFRALNDWERELSRTGCTGWRLSAINQSFQLSTSLPQWLVVPQAVLDWQLGDAARHFRGSRPPIWCWGSPQGAALVRMADIHPTITDRVKENVMLENVRKSHPQRKQPLLLDLSKDLPNPKDVQLSFMKLRELCAPESLRQFWVQDGHFFSSLENSRWLHIVSACLCKAIEAAQAIQRDETVVLQEGDGRDMCCIIASLVQILLDPYWRSLCGFQTLIQKEWVALGHPFCTRLAHVYSNDTEQSPEFLVFLDCMWQLLQQFPIEFEFTETYLTTLWDSAHVSIFETFLFDCERDRTLATESEPNSRLLLRSIWDWGEQFPERDIALFTNPLYEPCSQSNAKELAAQGGVSSLLLWKQCYFRWLPLLEIPGGGKTQVDLRIRQLTAEVAALQRGDSVPEQILTQVSSFFPFSHGVTRSGTLLASSLALNTSFMPGEALLDSQSLLNAPD